MQATCLKHYGLFHGSPFWDIYVNMDLYPVCFMNPIPEGHILHLLIERKTWLSDYVRCDGGRRKKSIFGYNFQPWSFSFDLAILKRVKIVPLNWHTPRSQEWEVPRGQNCQLLKLFEEDSVREYAKTYWKNIHHQVQQKVVKNVIEYKRKWGCSVSLWCFDLGREKDKQNS